MFDFLRNQGDIICVQEVHVDKDNENLFTQQWGGQAIWSPGTSNARGVGILIKPSFNVEILEVYVDNDRRSIITQICVEQTKYAILNLYAPNKDNPTFFQTCFDKINLVEGHKIVVGDFNTILDVNLDRTMAKKENKMLNNPRAAKSILAYMDELSLEDVWRVRNPQLKRYTWSRHKPSFVGSRLDYFLTDIEIAPWITNPKITTSVGLDHRQISLEVNQYAIRKGKGAWKFNNSVLAEKEFVDKINSVIDTTQKWASNLNARDKWDSMKMVIIQEIQEYTRNRAGERKIIKNQLMEMVEKLENNLSELSSQSDIDLLNKTKSDLDNIIQENTRGIIFRSKARWYNEGEKCTKYFLNLEKSRAGSKGMALICDENHQEHVNPTDILNIQENYYRKLYQKDPSIAFEFKHADLVPSVPNSFVTQYKVKFPT